MYSVTLAPVCLCGLCVCTVRALTFESLGLETSFLVRMYSSEHLGQGRYQGHGIKVKII